MKTFFLYFDYNYPFVKYPPEKNNDQEEIGDLLRNPDQKAMTIIYDRFAPVLYGFAMKLTGKELVADNLLEKAFLYICKNHQSYNSSKQSPLSWMIGIVRMIYLQSNLNIIKNENQLPDFYVDNSIIARSKTLNTEPDIVMGISLEHMFIFDQVFCGRNVIELANSLGKNTAEVKKMLHEAVCHYRKVNKLKWK